MGVIQQGVNQAFSMAGLAGQLYQQSPGFQKRQEEKEFEESTKQYIEGQTVLGKQRKLTKEGTPEREAIKNAAVQLGERRSSELLSRGRYVEWVRQEKHNAINRAGHFGKEANIVEYDEQMAQEANQRAEDTARQASEQAQRNRDLLNQLRGVNRVSQAFLHKEGIK